MEDSSPEIGYMPVPLYWALSNYFLAQRDYDKLQSPVNAQKLSNANKNLSDTMAWYKDRWPHVPILWEVDSWTRFDNTGIVPIQSVHTAVDKG